MSAELARAGTAGLEGTYAFAVGDERFAVEVAGDDVRVHDGASPAAADAGVSADPETFFAVATGALTPRAAARSVRIAVTGDTRRMLALLGAFRLPAAQ
jgi:predicted lipid carrier protein YhbT